MPCPSTPRPQISSSKPSCRPSRRRVGRAALAPMGPLSSPGAQLLRGQEPPWLCPSGAGGLSQAHGGGEMGGEGRAFSSHALQVKRGSGCPAAAASWHSPVPHYKNSGSPVPRHCWTGMEIGSVGGGKVTLCSGVCPIWMAPGTQHKPIPGPWDLNAVPGPVLGILGAQAPDLGSGVLGCSAGCWAPSRAGSALSSKCCPLFCPLAAGGGP